MSENIQDSGLSGQETESVKNSQKVKIEIIVQNTK